ncbi:MAG: S-layer homology domain-containing protein, partial [Cohnella sp.]|nr:S-layer homology domain-containing protein [Cohnella sp.]
YGTDQGTGAIAKEDLQLVFTYGSGASAVVIREVKKSNNAAAESAGELTGGETTIRVFLTVTGTDNGTGKIEIKPADGSSIYDKAGNAALASVTTGRLDMKNTLQPVNNTPLPTTVEDDGVAVIVNGVKQDKTASAKVTTVDNKKVTTITVDEQKLNQKLQTVEPGYKVTIPVNNQSDIIVGELNAQMVKNMESKQAVLEVQTEKASYTLPAEQVNVDAISRKVGSSVALDDIKVRVEISNVDGKDVKFVPQPNSAIALIAPAIEFRITAIHDGRTVNVDKFNAYVERTIAIPEGVDPNKITTGIVVQPDGSIVHVPTKVIEQSGRYFAVINSLTNSVYSVIYNVKTFEDIRAHWAKDAIEDMASRLVIAGKSDAKFAPEADITRAEFTAIMVRALGLRIADGERAFSDVKSGDWYASAVQIAVSYGLIEGYEDGTFRPDAPITREHAMVIIARAMQLVNMDMSLSADKQAELIASFSDRGSISGWAKQSVALNVYHGIFRGNDNRLKPQDNISRAETASIVRKLLQQADLIND